MRPEQEQQGPAARLAAMRMAFDEGFAAARDEAAKPGVALVGFMIGEERFAFRLLELAGLVVPPPIVPLPATPAALLGLVGLRGQLLPTYDLARLLGLTDERAPAWLAVVGREQPVALAFAELTGHQLVPPEALVPLATARAARAGLQAIVRLPGAPTAVLDLQAIAERARQLVPPPAPGGPSPC